ncbi:ABC transporter permease [Planctomycetota bacterium]|nr:ABC transporter permease [Planctomycetota bacterium]
MAAPADHVRTLEIRVGLLVVAGLAAAMTMILLSDRISFERDYAVAVYLQDAGGLRERSPVTLAGLRIGEVVKVEPVRDSRGPIRAHITISSKYPLPGDSSVVLATSGIFGDSSLAFSVPAVRRSDAGALPMDGTAELAAGASFLDTIGTQAKGIAAAVEDILAENTRKDLKRLIASAADLAGEASALAKGLNEQQAKIGETLDAVKLAVERLSTTADTLAKRVDGVAAQAESAIKDAGKAVSDLSARGTKTLEKLDGTLTKVDGLVATVDGGLTAELADVQKTTASLRTLLDRVAAIAAVIQSGQGLIGQLLANPQMTGDVHRLLIDAKAAAAVIADHPSSVVWGLDDDQAAAAKAERDRELVRRAHANGFPAPDAEPAPARPEKPAKP